MMKVELFQAKFKGGASNGMTFSVEVGQMVLYSIEVKEGEEVKHISMGRRRVCL
jgi:hypothetical protein